MPEARRSQAATVDDYPRNMLFGAARNITSPDPLANLEGAIFFINEVVENGGIGAVTL